MKIVKINKEKNTKKRYKKKIQGLFQRLICNGVLEQKQCKKNNNHQ